MGALPIANKYAFCVGRPEEERRLSRDKEGKEEALSPRRILDGIVAGVNEGGNCSGIPTPTGLLCVDDSYRGKPLVFVGTVGLLPRKLPDGSPAHEKGARPGDAIVMVGGRVGKDGIHGATFSSEALDEGSPATAVQIGDPITQKKLSDALVKEARDAGLYRSITDNGAGGLSCSVAEMAEESGGFAVELERVPVKYPGIEPWEIWISESQERMTLAVPPERTAALLELLGRRGVEATVIGRFTDDGRARVTLNGETILDLDMEFLHHGLPRRQLRSRPYPYRREEPTIELPGAEALLFGLVGSHNCASSEWISRQYDHEVQGGSVIKPLQGAGRVQGAASAIAPVPGGERCAILSQALLPRLSEIDCHAMAMASVDMAIRSAVAAGADPARLALMDNFCWCSSDEPERLGQLLDAARGCHDAAVAYQAPLISGKDSMFNDFKGYEEGEPVTISVLPTLMISALGVADVARTATMEPKAPGDLLYLVGETRDECGGSELYAHLGAAGGAPPSVEPGTARESYRRLHAAIGEGLVSACAPVNQGGLAVWLAKMSIAGQRGLEADLAAAPGAAGLDARRAAFSESGGRLLVTVPPAAKEAFEQRFKGVACAPIGRILDGKEFLLRHDGKELVRTTVKALERRYKERYGGY